MSFERVECVNHAVEIKPADSAER